MFINSCLYIQVKIKLSYRRFCFGGGKRTEGEAREAEVEQNRRSVRGGLGSSSSSSDPTVEDGL